MNSFLILQLEGLWVSYRMTSLSEADLYVTIPKFSILDIRPNAKAEMRLMLGSCTDVPKQMSPEHNADLPNSTMFLMDGRWRLSSQSFVVRVQQPRVLVVPDFLLAVCEFFVPALGTITGRDEMMDPKNDPISKKNSIVLSAPLYKQTEDVVQLSPSRQLVADAVGIDEYTYDGCGKTICLANGKEEKELHLFIIRPIIIIGRGKRLRFMNVKFEVLLLFLIYLFCLCIVNCLLLISLSWNEQGDYGNNFEGDGKALVLRVSYFRPENDEKSLEEFIQAIGLGSGTMKRRLWE